MPLVKATISTLNAAKKITVEAQFNPAELSIRYGAETKREAVVTADQKVVDETSTAGVPRETTLDLSLYFDACLMASALSQRALRGRDTAGIPVKEKTGEWDVSSDELNGQFASAVGELSQRVQDLKRLTRIDMGKHEPPEVRFSWGDFPAFVGHVQSVSVSYTQFDSSGNPTRAKVDLSITGQEEALHQEAGQRSTQSPDRTKERLLLETDQLWMLADSEYGDPALWKTIARANEILNPRAIGRAVRLKLPSIR